jgi:predicted Ser/Thr protein kinase
MAGLDPAGLLLGALGEVTASWPQEGQVNWQPPIEAEAAALFPGYTGVRFIGRGGMGAVYAARQVSLDRHVALKLLPAELSRNPAATERFRREARSLAKLSHPNIVGIHDFGETVDGSFFFVMEYVEGADLHKLIRDGELTLPRALGIVRQVCDALEYAHAQGFVHRDIKPANILVDAADRVKISDFGLARIIGDHPGTSHEPSPTLTGSIVGTPEYSAPEQRAGDQPVDHRADIYSLGVMFYEMLTGSVPRGAFEPPSRKAGVDEQMDRVVLRAMQPEPDKRYQCASEVKSDVERATRGRSLRRWLGPAAVLLCALGAAAAWKPRAEDSVRPGEASVNPFRGYLQNNLGMTFLPSGTPGVLMATTEVTRGQFALFARLGNREFSGEVYYANNGVWQTGEGSLDSPPGIPPQTMHHAVVAVTHDDAVAFCEALTQAALKGKLKPGERYRLPTAEEWARAARLPLEIRGYKLPPTTAPPEGLIAQSAPDAFGFHDLQGNVIEWTSTPGENPDEFLACGTGWTDAPLAPPARAIARAYDHNVRGTVLGFRIVLDSTACTAP